MKRRQINRLDLSDHENEAVVNEQDQVRDEGRKYLV